jgi:hypothetical protein
MTLQERMNAMKETFERTLSPEKRDIRYRATEDLRRLGILDRVIKVGAPIPEFTLPNARGEKVSSADLTAGGRMLRSPSWYMSAVMTFAYRMTGWPASWRHTATWTQSPLLEIWILKSRAFFNQ